MSNEIISREALMEMLSYDPETGVFVWKVRPCRNVFIGDIAGGFDDRGYRLININKRVYKAHRLAWLYVYGEWPKKHVDHINRNPRDNRIANLRDVDATLNRQNMVDAQKNNRSGYLGVETTKYSFVASIKTNGKSIKLGSFKDPISAHSAYMEAKKNIHRGAV